MRGRFSTFVFVALVLALLLALNAASYVRVEREPEFEATPDRSTSNAGPTGTRALYEFLDGSGRKVVRWRESPEALLRARGAAAPSVFVVVGPVRRQFTEGERKALIRWVEQGGRLVVIDRQPEEILPAVEGWGIASSVTEWPGSDARADDVERLLAGTRTLAPTQPTLLAAQVERIAPSRYAARLWPLAADVKLPEETGDESSPHDTYEEGLPEPNRPAPSANPRASPRTSAEVTRASAPVFNFTDARGALVADYTRGRGRVIVLADPFVVANNGIARADNLVLAANLFAEAGGPIAFDEYQQGRDAGRDQFAAYFAGTPVLALFGQVMLIAALFFWSRGRRFARPLPVKRPDRRSKLEFVASMAELQQRARAFDLAIENIYSRTRRALARYGGTDPSAPREHIAAAVSARSGLDRARLDSLLRDCEEAIAGEPVTARRALVLAAQLRELERALGIRMRAREIKQAERS